MCLSLISGLLWSSRPGTSLGALLQSPKEGGLVEGSCMRPSMPEQVLDSLEKAL